MTQPNSRNVVTGTDLIVNSLTIKARRGAADSGPYVQDAGIQGGQFVGKVIDTGGEVVNVARGKYGVASGSTAAANTTGIARAIADAGVNGVLLFASSLGAILHNGLASNQAGQHWIIQPGCTLKLANGANTDSILVSVARVTFDGGGVIDGNGTNNTGSGGAGRGIVCTADNLTVDLMTIQNTWHYCIQVIDGNKPMLTRNIITNPGAGGNSTIGIYVQATTADRVSPLIALNTVTVSLNNVQGISVHGTPATWNMLRVKIIGNDVSSPSNATGSLCIETWGGCPGAVVEGNTTSGGNYAISCDRSNQCSVAANTCFNSFSYGIELASSVRSACGLNTIDGNAVTVRGIVLDGATGSSYSTLTGNVVYNCTSYGINISNAAVHVGITGGVIQLTSGAPNPIYFQGGSNNGTVQGVHLIGGGGGSNYGVTFDASTGGLVQGCTFDGYATAAVIGYSGGVYTVDKLTVGPNHLVTAMSDLVATGAAVFGSNVRVIRGTVAPAGVAAITVTASPFTYTNNDLVPELVTIDGGTVTTVVKNAITLFSFGATAARCSVWLDPGEAVTATYTVAPTMNKDRK